MDKDQSRHALSIYYIVDTNHLQHRDGPWSGSGYSLFTGRISKLPKAGQPGFHVFYINAAERLTLHILVPVVDFNLSIQQYVRHSAYQEGSRDRRRSNGPWYSVS